MKLHAVLGTLEDKVSSTTGSQQLTVLEDKLGEIAIQLRNKKGVKKVVAREVGQCLNDNCFWDLNVDVALTNSPYRHQIVKDVPNIATKTIKHHACKCQKMQQNKYANR